MSGDRRCPMTARVAAVARVVAVARVEVVARGAADSRGPRPETRRPASFYADPVAWLIVDAVEDALRDPAGPGEGLRRDGSEVGVVSISEVATRHTMRQMSAAVHRGRVSPLRFAGANPGSIAGLPCIVLGFRGPSLVLSMPPAAGRPVAESIGRAWLASGACRFVVVNEHEADSDDAHTVRTRVLALADVAEGRTNAPVGP